MDSSVSVRAISRCLAVLKVLNTEGSLSVMQIARLVGLSHSTAGRIVETLVRESMLEREPHRKRYRVTHRVQSLAHGFQDHSGLTQAARPEILALTARYKWPMILASRTGLQMMVRDCTHSVAPFALYRFYPGFTVSILGSALGRAYLAFASDAERTLCLENLRKSAVETKAPSHQTHDADIPWDEIRERGFAIRGRANFRPEDNTSSLAVPLFVRGEVRGALAIAFLTTAVSMTDAVHQFSDDLKLTAQRISVGVEAFSNEPWTPLAAQDGPV